MILSIDIIHIKEDLVLIFYNWFAGENQLKVCCEQLHEIEDMRKIISTEPLKGEHGCISLFIYTVTVILNICKMEYFREREKSPLSASWETSLILAEGTTKARY